jgi:single-strand DNA-binding protein
MMQVTIAGNIGRDAEVRKTQDGTAVAGFSVAVETRAGREKVTQWFDVSVWGARGEKLAPYLTKGGKVAVAGELGTREHNGKTYLTVRASEITLMGGGNRDGGAPAGGAPMGGVPDDLGGDEIPFRAW